MQHIALPIWSNHGFDDKAGRFWERLNPDCSPRDTPFRAMVQARQIYVFARAAKLNWLPDGRRIAEIATDSLLRDFCDEDRGRASFAFSINGAGQVRSAVRDTYAHAFILLALAALYDLNRNPDLLAVADRVVHFIDHRLADEIHGGLADAFPAGPVAKRQNPHMHLLEAYLLLAEVAPERDYLDRAAAIIALMKRRFLDRRSSVLLEYFSEDWSAPANDMQAGIWEPGHHFEWAWLLGEYARLTGLELEPCSHALYDLARLKGVAPNGLLVGELASDGMRILDGSHRIWPHTEAIKAGLMRAAGGDAEAGGFAERMAGRLLDTFLDAPFKGGWIDHVSPAGDPLLDYVPASSLYHLFLAATEAASHLAHPGPDAVTLSSAAHA